jgi:hypothetical protein
MSDAIKVTPRISRQHHPRELSMTDLIARQTALEEEQVRLG